MRLRLLVSEAWRSLWANVSTTVAATMTVLVGMFLLGLFVAFGTYVVSWSNHVKRELIVKVDFNTGAAGTGKPQATRAQEAAVVRMLQANPQVKSWTFVSKAVALERMKKRYPKLTSDLPYNPLPDSLEITPTKGEYVQAVAATVVERFAPSERHASDTSSLMRPLTHTLLGARRAPAARSRVRSRACASCRPSRGRG